MKCSKKILLGTVLWAVANGVYASAANLQVAGTLLPTSCIPSFPAGGIYDLGTGSIKSLSATEATVLPRGGFDYSIDCDAPIAVSYRFLDNRADTIVGAANRDFAYGLGRQGTSSLGHSTMILWGNGRADGQPADLLRTIDAGATWGLIGSVQISKSWSFSFTSRGGTAPQAFSRYEGSIGVTPILRPVSQLDVDEEIVLDGSMTMEVVYL